MTDPKTLKAWEAFDKAVEDYAQVEYEMSASDVSGPRPTLEQLRKARRLVDKRALDLIEEATNGYVLRLAGKLDEYAQRLESAAATGTVKWLKDEAYLIAGDIRNLAREN